MRIHRSMPADGWVPIANAAARDHRLSWRARGLLLELLSYPDGWETSVDKLSKQAKRVDGKSEGREAMRHAMAELAEVGYVKYVRRHDERGRWTTVITVSDITGDLYWESRVLSSGTDPLDVPEQSPAPNAALAKLTALYRWFDSVDRLLYVGITYSLLVRQTNHAQRSSWTEFAARSTVEHFSDRAAAEAAEEAAIKAEVPLFNREYNDSAEARERLVAYLVEKGRVDLLIPAVSRG